MREVPPNLPLVRILAQNTFLLSAGYLLVGLVVEVVRQLSDRIWAAQLTLAVDALPIRALDQLGLLMPLNAAVREERLPPFVFRLVLSGTMMLLIAALAVGLGLLMAAVRKMSRPRPG